MRRQSKKLSGPALARYLRRFFADAPGLPPETAEQLAARSTAAFTSVRVRDAALARANVPPRPTSKPRVDGTPAAATPAPSPAAPAAAPAPASAPFDPYAIGLVPTFQREGRDGLIARLAAIATVDDLRRMARAQNIVLADALKAAEATPETLRAGIADAVAKRVADRRAAAG